MNESRRIEASTAAFGVRNTPLRPRDRRELLERDGMFHIESDEGEIILVHEEGQQKLYWGFSSPEAMRQDFSAMWQETLEHIDRESIDYVSMDLSGIPNTGWLGPLLKDADFEFFAEWMEMSNPDVDGDAVPEFPDGVSMRKASDDDVERIYEIWTEAYGDYADGAATFDWLTSEAAWAGVLEDEDGEVLAFAFNSDVERGEGRVLAAAVAPEAWGNGYGRVILAAATYQLAASEAVRVTVRVRPDIKQGLKTCADLGFKFARAGLEYRRSTDEEALAEAHEAKRVSGVRPRFGQWR